MIYSTKCIVHYIVLGQIYLYHFPCTFNKIHILNNKQMEETIQTVVCQSHLAKTDLSSN